MSLWSTVKEKVQGMIGVKNIEQTLHISPAISSKMIDAIDEWTAMYEDRADWLHEPDFKDHSLVTSLGLPAFIASEKARMAVLELQSEITAPMSIQEVVNPEYQPPVSDINGNISISNKPKTVIKEKAKSPTERAEFMNKEYQDKLLSRLRTQLELGIAKGSLIIKPYVTRMAVAEVAGLDNSKVGAKAEQKSEGVANAESTNEQSNSESSTNDTEGTAEIKTDKNNKKYKYAIEFDFVQADCFYPFSFDSSGNLIEVAFLQTKVDKEYTYTRLEYHKLENNTVTITNRAFRSLNRTDNTMTLGNAVLGAEIELKQVPEWKNIPQRATIKNVDRMMFGYFKMPEANTIDPHSPLGISGFARAKELIKQADLQYSRLLWEYEGGELAIDIDRDALTDVTDFKGNSHSMMGHLQQRLYRPVDLGESDTYKPYAPSLRDASMINGLNTLLMRIEDVVALSRGTIADVSAEARTATEIKILKQRSYASNAEIQKALESALKDVIYAMDVYCTIYNIVGDVVIRGGKVDTKKLGLYDVSFTWDDSILVDMVTELNTRLTLMDKGLASKLETRMWYYGETKRQAMDALQRVQEESQQAIEQNMAVSSMMAQGQPSPNSNGNSQSPTNSDKGDEESDTSVSGEQQNLNSTQANNNRGTNNQGQQAPTPTNGQGAQGGQGNQGNQISTNGGVGKVGGGAYQSMQSQVLKQKKTKATKLKTQDNV